MPLNDISSYNALFLETAKEHVSAIENALNSQNENLLNEVFRRAHSLKGSSEMMNHEKISNICHEIINLIRPEDVVLQIDENDYKKLKDLASKLKEQVSLVEAGGENNSV